MAMAETSDKHKLNFNASKLKELTQTNRFPGIPIQNFVKLSLYLGVPRKVSVIFVWRTPREGDAAGSGLPVVPRVVLACGVSSADGRGPFFVLLGREVK